MDRARVGRELAISFRTLVLREWRLFAIVLLAVVGYGLWVGATGAAVVQIGSYADISTAVDPWTTETTALAVCGVVLWLVAPALVAVWLINRELKNIRGNLERYYRIYPPLLLVPPVILLACAAIPLVVIGPDSNPALALLVVAALFFQIRTLAHSYRVFSFSIPRIHHGCLFVTTSIAFLTLLVEGSIALGYEGYVTDSASGMAELLGIPWITDLLGTTTMGSVSVPTLPGSAIVAPLAISGAYISLQSIIGLLVRLRGKIVNRSTLRTGQRYPKFAQPPANEGSRSSQSSSAAGSKRSASTTSSTSKTKESSSTAQSSSSPAGSQSAQSGAQTSKANTGNGPGQRTASNGPKQSHTGDEKASGQSETQSAADDETEDVTHTRVFTPETDSAETNVFEADENKEDCPYCNATLAAGADSCDTCGASL